MFRRDAADSRWPSIATRASYKRATIFIRDTRPAFFSFTKETTRERNRRFDRDNAFPRGRFRFPRPIVDDRELRGTQGTRLAATRNCRKCTTPAVCHADNTDGVGRTRTQDVERRQGFTGPDHRSRRFSAFAGEESLQEEEATAKGEKHPHGRMQNGKQRRARSWRTSSTPLAFQNFASYSRAWFEHPSSTDRCPLQRSVSGFIGSGEWKFDETWQYRFPLHQATNTEDIVHRRHDRTSRLGLRTNARILKGTLDEKRQAEYLQHRRFSTFDQIGEALEPEAKLHSER